jgi:hypothetical protein
MKAGPVTLKCWIFLLSQGEASKGGLTGPHVADVISKAGLGAYMTRGSEINH